MESHPPPGGDAHRPYGDAHRPYGDEPPYTFQPPSVTRGPSPATLRAALEAIARDIQLGQTEAGGFLLKELFQKVIDMAFEMEVERAGHGRKWLAELLRGFTAEHLVPHLWRAACATHDEPAWPIWLRGVFQSCAKRCQVGMGVVESRWMACGNAHRLEHYVEAEGRLHVHAQSFEPDAYWPRTGELVCFVLRPDSGVRFLPLVRIRR